MPSACEVVAGQHRQHARGGAGGGGVDASDPGVRHRRADQHGAHQAVDRHVVGVHALSGEKALVFLALHALTDAELRHGTLIC